MLVPFLAIISQLFLGINTPFMYTGYVLTIILGILFLTTKKEISIPIFLWLLVPYFIYKYIVDFNFNELSHGSYYLTLRQDLFIIATFFALIMIFNSLITDNYVKIIDKYLLAVVIGAPIFTLVQVYYPLFLSPPDLTINANSLYDIRRSSFFGFEDPNALAFTYLPLAYSFIGYYLLKKRMFLAFYLLCIGLVLIFSNTRYVMVGFIFVILQLILSKRNRLFTALRYLVVALICIIFLYYIVIYVGYDLNSFYNIRLDDKGNIFARVQSYETFLEVFPRYFLFGTGNEKAPVIISSLRGYSPVIHVGFLNHLVTYGIFGSFFLFGFWFGLFRSLYSRAKKTKYWAGAIALMFFFWSNLSVYMYSIFFSGFLINLILERYNSLKILEEQIANKKYRAIKRNKSIANMFKYQDETQK
jgi:hypothetical protein